MNDETNFMAVLQAAGDMTAPPPSSDGRASLAILVAEDGQVTQDLLKLPPTQRGHRVDLVDDGWTGAQGSAGAPLRYRLGGFPPPDNGRTAGGCGVQVSPAAVAGSHHFIGITADAAGFMAHPDNWRSFDLVIAKPDRSHQPGHRSGEFRTLHGLEGQRG